MQTSTRRRHGQSLLESVGVDVTSVASIRSYIQILHRRRQSPAWRFYCHIENMKATMHTESTNWASATPGMANSLDIVDEMADRDRRKCNLVVYNFVESDDKGKDIELFQGFCSDQ